MVTILMHEVHTAQMQLHSRVQMSSKALKELLKVTRYKLCECLRFSTLSSLVRITNSVFVYQLVTTLVANVLIPKGHATVGSFTRICPLVIINSIAQQKTFSN